MTTAAAACHYGTIDPYTGEVKKEFDALDPSGLDRAVAIADEAFAAWRSRPVEERAQTVRRAGE
jgi:succinate-semialdehyde dehydrogenase/glutarate-semialdehyde dehydrogenase